MAGTAKIEPDSMDGETCAPYSMTGIRCNNLTNIMIIPDS